MPAEKAKHLNLAASAPTARNMHAARTGEVSEAVNMDDAWRRRIRIAAWVLSAVFPAAAAAVTITIDTTALTGQDARLAFTLLDGDFAANNSVTISNLVTDGTPGPSDCTLGCSGGPPFSVDDGIGLGEFLQDLTLGSYVRFDLGFTTAFSGSGAPDRFTLNLLDAASNFTLVDTELDFLFDPVPAQDALLLIDLQDPAVVRLAEQGVPIRTSDIPAPATPALVVAALAALRRRRGGAASRRG